jgi:hypothetical protein
MNIFITFLKTFHWIVQLFCPTNRVVPEVSIHKLPWFWVGCEVDNTTIDITEKINKSLKYSKLVTPEFLSEISGYKTSKWMYIDALTLEQRDFPLSGIVIKES